MNDHNPNNHSPWPSDYWRRPTASDYTDSRGYRRPTAPLRFRPLNLTPRISFPPPQLDELRNGISERDEYPPWTSYGEHDDIRSSAPFTLSSYGSSPEQSPRQPPVRILVMGNPRPPSFNIGQRTTNNPTRYDRPERRLDEENQDKAVAKLRKEIYIPPAPPRNPAARRLTLYYREPGLGLLHNNNKNNVNAVSDDDGKRCAVCLEDFERGESVMLTPCDHMFHQDCIVPWVKSNGQCPVCRYSIGERSRVRETTPLQHAAFNGDHVLTEELISIIRAMEEAFISR